MTSQKSESNLSRLIQSVDTGDMEAADELLPQVYDELRKLAQSRLRRDRAGNSLAPTDLVHEVYHRLIQANGGDQPKWNGLPHFFAAASEAMRRILVDRARHRAMAKRGGNWTRVGLSSVLHPSEENPKHVMDLHEALTRLEQDHPKKATVVKMRFFMGMPMQQISEALEISPATAGRYWAYARAWLKTEIEEARLSEDG